MYKFHFSCYNLIMNKTSFLENVHERVIESFNDLKFSESRDRWGNPLEKNYIPMYDSLAFLANAPNDIEFSEVQVVVSFECFVGYVFEYNKYYIYLDFMKCALRLYVHDKVEDTAIFSKTIKNKSDYWTIYQPLKDYINAGNKAILIS